MKQLVVISGKGGTGKTSIVASFAALAPSVVLADCDVDAADLHLVLAPKVIYRESFSGSKQAVVDTDLCSGCGVCEELCRFEAISMSESEGDRGGTTAIVDALACEGCAVCAWFCPENAIELQPVTDGEWFRSQTRHGPMVHARLAAAAESSGKLVSLVRSNAREAASTQELDVVIVDGSPGIGCPVIASITGADLALIVTEPTLSGLHDLGRVLELTRHFGIPVMVLVNKYDLNLELAAKAEEMALEGGARLAGRIRFDHAVTEAQVAKTSVVEHSINGAAADITDAWAKVQDTLGSLAPSLAMKG